MACKQVYGTKTRYQQDATKMHRGTIAMWKINILAVLLLFGFLAVVIKPVFEKNKAYWESIGPAWDQMLNPNKYSNEE